MTLDSIIDAGLVFCHLDAVSKKRVFEHFAQQVAELDTALDSQAIFEGLFTREKLGSTALGNGIAIPHCRLPGDGVSHAALITLAKPIDFDAPDSQPVDLLIFLVVAGDATQEHLNMLATISRALSDTSFCQRLRACQSDAELAAMIHKTSTP